MQVAGLAAVALVGVAADGQLQDLQRRAGVDGVCSLTRLRKQVVEELRPIGLRIIIEQTRARSAKLGTDAVKLGAPPAQVVDGVAANALRAT